MLVFTVTYHSQAIPQELASCFERERKKSEVEGGRGGGGRIIIGSATATDSSNSSSPGVAPSQPLASDSSRHVLMKKRFTRSDLESLLLPPVICDMNDGYGSGSSRFCGRGSTPRPPTAAGQGSSGGKGAQGDHGTETGNGPSAKKCRHGATGSVASSQAPANCPFSSAPPPFESCLENVVPNDRLGGAVNDGDDMATVLTTSLDSLHEAHLGNSGKWLASEFMDVMLAKLARAYPKVHYMPADFAVRCLNRRGSTRASPSPFVYSAVNTGTAGTSAAAAAAALTDKTTTFPDILGHAIDYEEKRPVIFLTHVNNMQWNLVRVVHNPDPELQVFEPMGKRPQWQGSSLVALPGVASTSAFRDTTGFQCTPTGVYDWLDKVWPLDEPVRGRGPNGFSSSRGCAALAVAGGRGEGSGGAGSKRKTPSPSEGWASHEHSAITRQHQTTELECGVAVLLYAEKCGQGQTRETVDVWTKQEDVELYRKALKQYVEEVLPPASAAAASSIAANTDASSSAGSGSVDIVTAATPPTLQSTPYFPPPSIPSPPLPPPTISPMPPPALSPPAPPTMPPPPDAGAPVPPVMGWERRVIDLT